MAKDKLENKDVFGAGMLAVSIAGLYQIMSIPVLDWPLTIALYCYSICIPTLTVWILMFRLHFAGKSFKSKTSEAFTSISIFISFMGLLFTIAHHSIIAAAIFFVASLVSLIYFIKFLVVWIEKNDIIKDEKVSESNNEKITNT